ncbi:MAG: hypothetical protein GC137_09485 [Alphaproteobacteria bacterium]|nr:hypothetical protein [Alphaproteobacteria bacterium]
MDSQKIIMNFTVPPSLEDIECLSAAIMETLPDELDRHCEDLVVTVEDMPDDTTLDDLDLDDPFELLALYKSGKEISPGIEKKIANEEDVLTIYRRPFLDMWCETEEDILTLLRQTMIEELGRYFEFSEDDIQDMTDMDYQEAI